MGGSSSLIHFFFILDLTSLKLINVNEENF